MNVDQQHLALDAAELQGDFTFSTAHGIAVSQYIVCTTAHHNTTLSINFLTDHVAFLTDF